MPYEVEYAPKGSRVISNTVMPTAREALETVQAFQAGDEEIRRITTLNGSEIGIGELQLLAQRESDAGG
jgi:hypothetical protein